MAAADYDFTLTRNEIIRSALRLVGALAVGQNPTADMQAAAADALNRMVKSWQNEHIFLWRLVDKEVTLADGDADYTLGDDPPFIGVWEAWVKDAGDTSENYVPVKPWSEYLSREGDTQETSEPCFITYDPVTKSAIKVWPTPSETKTLRVVGVAKLKDFDSAAGTADFESKWLDSLVYGLAHRLAPEYGLPASEKRDLKIEAEGAFYKAKMADRTQVAIETVKGAF